ncbi:MAG: DUF2807 domain-containing protein [Muribaculaceae bacterium]|nr:DUF2807 domain-containing protein [Muribaculaceae bacterium]
MMKKQLLFLAAMSVLMMLLFGCQSTGTAGNGNDAGGDSAAAAPHDMKQQEMVMEPFDAVVLDGAANITYDSGGEHRVRIEAPGDVLNHVNVWVEDGELHVGDRPGAEGVRFDSVTVHVTSPQLTVVSLNGAGNFTAKARLAADQMRIALAGAGNVSLAALTCRRLVVELSGAGNVTVDGLTTSLAETTLTGAGNVTLNGKADRHVERVDGPGHIDISHLESTE